MSDEARGRRPLCGGQAEYLWHSIPDRRWATEWRLRTMRGPVCLTLRGVSRSRQRADDAARWGVGLLDELAALLRQAAEEAGLADAPARWDTIPATPEQTVSLPVETPAELPAGACSSACSAAAEIERLLSECAHLHSALVDSRDEVQGLEIENSQLRAHWTDDPDSLLTGEQWRRYCMEWAEWASGLVPPPECGQWGHQSLRRLIGERLAELARREP